MFKGLFWYLHHLTVVHFPPGNCCEDAFEHAGLGHLFIPAAHRSNGSTTKTLDNIDGVGTKNTISRLYLVGLFLLEKWLRVCTDVCVVRAMAGPRDITQWRAGLAVGDHLDVRITGFAIRRRNNGHVCKLLRHCQQNPEKINKYIQFRFIRRSSKRLV